MSPTSQQKSYLQNYVRAFEKALYSDDFADPSAGYRKFLDVPSFIDYFIVSEVSRNVDGYKKSRFFYKDKDSNDGRLYAGPVWDMDWAWKNIGECIFGATDGSGWSYRTNDCHPDNYTPGWYVRLLQDKYFTNSLIDRYIELRSGILDLQRMFSYIDSVRAFVDDAQKRHFALWPIDRDYRAPEVDAPSRTYDQEIAKLENWIRLRIDWLDVNIPLLREEIVTDTPAVHDEKKPELYHIFPNPASEHIFLKSELPFKRITIFNILGQQVYDAEFFPSFAKEISLDGLQSGKYFIKIQFQNGSVQVQKQVILK